MPIVYHLNSELNLIIYVCRGVINETEFFQSVAQAQHHPSWRSRMFTLIDTLNAEIDFRPSELRHTLEWLNQQNPQPVAILAQRRTTQLLIETINFLDLNAPHLFTIENLEEALPILELQNRASEVYAFWQAAQQQNV